MGNYKTILFFVMLFFVAVYSTGCATVTRGTTEAFIIETEPIGATATLSTGEMCKTPCNLLKKHKDEFSVHIEKEGYEPVDMQIKSQIVGAGGAGLAGNVIVGGVIGLGVDAISGAAKGLKPNPAKVTLVPIDNTTKTTNVLDLAETKICPYCGETLNIEYTFCKFCHKDLKDDKPIKEIEQIDEDVGKNQSI